MQFDPELGVSRNIRAPQEAIAALPESPGLETPRQRALERLFRSRLSARQMDPDDAVASRRSFLSVAAHTVIGGGAWGALGRSLRANADAGTSLEGLSAATQASAFAWEAILFQCGQYALGQLVRHLGLPIGNATLTRSELTKEMVVRTIEAFERDPLLPQRLYASVGWLGPATEEALFRIAPGLLIGREGMQPGAGLTTSFVFAAMHNVVPASHRCENAIPLGDSVKLSLDRVPLPQFLLGAYCWYVMRRYGELAPVIAHALNNQGAAFAVVWGGKDTFREYQRLLDEELQREAPV